VSSNELLVNHAGFPGAQDIAQASRFLEDIAATAGLIELEDTYGQEELRAQ
jgi:hypothetical protein